MKLINKAGFSNNNQFYGFLAVVLSGQLIYSCFEAFKGTFYNVLLQVLGITNTQMGMLFSLIGIAVFFYVPGGWVNNRFSVRSILITSLISRMLSVFVIVFFNPSFSVLSAIATIWGLTDAVFWPAVLNGVTMMSGEDKKALGFGLLESIRRATEMGMNVVLVGIMAALGGSAIIFKGGMLVYNLLIIPVVFFVYKYVPKNEIKVSDNENKSKAALKGLLHVLKMPTVWMASITALSVYWCYINLIYTVPYLQAVFNISQAQASIFGIINTGAMGVVAGLISGTISDYVFKSSSKMMFVSLALTSIALVLTLIMPKSENMLMANIILLMLFSFSIFLSKGIILAPITEANVPKDYSGSSMSVGSFAAYAPVFWVYGLNGKIIDTYEPIVAYQKIFTIGVVVALAGMVCAFILLIMNNKNKKIKTEETDI